MRVGLGCRSLSRRAERVLLKPLCLVFARTEQKGSGSPSQPPPLPSSLFAFRGCPPPNPPRTGPDDVLEHVEAGAEGGGGGGGGGSRLLFFSCPHPRVGSGRGENNDKIFQNFPRLRPASYTYIWGGLEVTKPKEGCVGVGAGIPWSGASSGTMHHGPPGGLRGGRGGEENAACEWGDKARNPLVRRAPLLTYPKAHKATFEDWYRGKLLSSFGTVLPNHLHRCSVGERP